MKIYLVGGAVRDEILGLPVKDRDWLVVGATPEDLIANNFQQVGREFPVFLHPETKEEYALARTERKSGTGYHGFICDFSPLVTLEEDLLRRDLTINAIAKNSDGEIFDPYGGINDIHCRILRHVSDAFVEDPLRVLRILRFYARFVDMGFTIAPETLNLCKKIVESGELKELKRERVLLECMKALQTAAPEKFFEGLWNLNALKILGFSCSASELQTLNGELKNSLQRTKNTEYRLAMWLRLASDSQRQGFLHQLPISTEAKYWVNLVADYGRLVIDWENCAPETRWEILKITKSLREQGKIKILLNLMNVAAEIQEKIFNIQQRLIRLDTQTIVTQSKNPADIGKNIKLAQLEILKAI